VTRFYRQDCRFDNLERESVLVHVHSQVLGWGADRRRDERPGVPRESPTPEPVGRTHWSVPDPQLSRPVPVVAAGRRLTPVYSTSVPPRGLSGALRKLAYRYPDWYVRRWAVLRVADRVDVIEHTPASLAKALGAAVLFAVGLEAARRRV